MELKYGPSNGMPFYLQKKPDLDVCGLYLHIPHMFTGLDSAQDG